MQDLGESMASKYLDQYNNGKMEKLFPNIYRVPVPLPDNPLEFLNSYFILSEDKTTIVDVDLQAIAEGMDSQAVDEVTLITAKEQLNLDEDAFIKYSKEGKVAVNSQVIKEEGEKARDEQEYNQLLVPPGKRARIELSDGTRLVVNSQSKVVYPRRFKGNIRKT